LQLSIVTYGSAISALMGDEWEVERPKKPWQIALDLFGEIRFGGFEPWLCKHLAFLLCIEHG